MRLLVKRWRKLSEQYTIRSKEILEDLRTGKLPREDAIISSVYEIHQAAITLDGCVSEVEYFLRLKAKKKKDQR